MSSISKICTRIFFAGLLAAQSASAFAPIRIRATGSTINTGSSIHTNTNLYAAAAATATSTPIAEGLTKTILQQGNGPSLKLGEVATVTYTCSLAGHDTSFARSNKQKVVVGDGVMIDAWDKALATMYVGEKALIRISEAAAEQYGYGKDGVPGFIPSNAAIEIEIQVLDAEEQKTMGVSGVAGMTGSGDLGLLDPSKPVSSFSLYCYCYCFLLVYMYEKLRCAYTY